jgi:hypothetical protein
MRYRSLLYLGPLRSPTIILSLVLGEPPAGRARTYPLRQEEMRCAAMEGVQMHRLRSVWGIAVVYDVRDDSLRCKFRVRAIHQRGNVVTGWSRMNPLYLLGEVHAVENPAKVEELLAKSEVGDWTRREKQPGDAPETQDATPADAESAASDTSTSAPSADVREESSATLIGTPWVSERKAEQE